MDLGTLKKKLSSYKNEKGRLKNVSDDLLMEILAAWENWTGPATQFYRALGTGHKQFASCLGRAKKLKREGYGASDFEEILPEATGNVNAPGRNCDIELMWDGGRVIRFGRVEVLVDFLKKAA